MQPKKNGHAHKSMTLIKDLDKIVETMKRSKIDTQLDYIYKSIPLEKAYK